MNKKYQLWLSLMRLGRLTGCHQMESRSFSFRGYQFPICARCTGLLIGEIAGIISIIAGYRLSWTAIILLIAAMGTDWLIQELEIKMSNNHRRFITGTACGVGVTYLYFYVVCSLSGMCLVVFR